MIVFVHGVPETAAIWTEVRSRIDEESVALSMPGFGCERPAGFGAGKDAYVEWLVADLRAIGSPVHLVGHDWGAGLVYRVAATAPELLRSWTIDVANIVHPDYVWHEFAQVWQTPGAGEAAFTEQLSRSVEEAAAGYQLLGIPEAAATEMAAGLDETMASCILDLYRSATPCIAADWGPPRPSAAAGMVLCVADDPFGDDAMAAEVAQATGARIGRLDGGGHFWPYAAPEQGAAVLTAFWADLDESAEVT